MKKLIALACLGFAVVVSAPAFAGAQQDKMKGCNAEAKADALKGDERRAFMKKCLKKDYTLKADAAAKPEAKAEAKPEAKPAAKPEAKPAASAVAAPVTQQEKMKSCNADAATKGLKGDERRAFMKICLKG